MRVRGARSGQQGSPADVGLQSLEAGRYTSPSSFNRDSSQTTSEMIERNDDDDDD